SIFNPSDYETFDEAMEALEFIANNRGLGEKAKLEFNRNFYGFISMIQKHFDLDFDLFRETAQGIAKLAALTPDEADRITLEGDDDKYTLKLLDTSGKYPSAFIPETGKCRFPSQWFKFYHVVMVNEL
ncbi:MAG: hypothetical protein U9N86_08190, partial [Bacteroidota bacterium]|nr:hypothetical protein [Bacteroidota bacterium]